MVNDITIKFTADRGTKNDSIIEYRIIKPNPVDLTFSQGLLLISMVLLPFIGVAGVWLLLCILFKV